MQRLRANIFETDGSLSPFPVPGPTSAEAFDGQKYLKRDSRTRNPGHQTYSGEYSSKTTPLTDGSYDDSQVFLTSN